MSPWVPVTFLLGAAFSAALAWETHHSNERMTSKALAVELHETADAVVHRIELYQFGLRGLRGAIQAVQAQGMSLEAFQRYSATRDIPQEFPGARGFGYIARVADDQQAAFIDYERRHGRLDFSVRQFQPYSGEHFLVRYISPLANNQSAIGLDIASDPVRRQAALEAMRSGAAQLTRPIVLLQSAGENQKAFLILLPVYRDPATPQTVAEREASTIGWSYAALQIDEVLENLGVYHVGLSLQLFDASDTQSPELFYDDPVGAASGQAVASQTVEREVFGRKWRLQMQAYPAFVASLNQTSARLVLVLGLVLSGMLAALLGMLDNMRRRRIEVFTDQARLAAIVESSFDGIVGKDLDGVIKSWNKGAELIFGFSAEQAVGKRLADLLVPAALQSQEQDILARINRGERVEPFETVRLHRDGHLVDVSVAVAPIRDGTGAIVGASKTVRDISIQKAAEAKLQTLYSDLETQVTERTAELHQAKLQADAANAAKSSFLANMSHEIRTPLNGVLGMLQLLLHTPLNARQSDYVSKARSAATALLDILNDILDFSKIEAGKLQLDLHRFELEPLMRRLAVVLSGNQADKPVEVMFDLSPNLPSVLVGDSLRLQQILINLAGNALKFTGRGYVIVSVTELQQDPRGVLLRIAVTDTGIGIAKEHQQHIFEGFAQAEASTSRRFGGSGLGLVICKRLVELMGSQLHVDSELGKGSRFWFDLHFAVEPGKTLRTDCQTSDRALRILIADDNTVAAELMCNTVRELGWQADLVSNGREAVERVKTAQEQAAPYDVVLMDWRMPELDGFEAAQIIQMQCAPHQQPVLVMITAYGREALAQIQESAESPFIDFLTKPITPQQLAYSVQQALANDGTSGQENKVLLPQSTRLHGVRILVVEDNALNRMVASELLEHEGAIVQLAEGGLQGVTLALCASPEFDVVIMDIQMPDIDGYEAARRIREERSAAHLPILAMTANASDTDRQLCLAAGMNDHVGKPIDIDQVVKAVLRLTNGAVASVPETPVAAPVLEDTPLLEDGTSLLNRFAGNIDLIRRLYREFQHDAQALLDDLEQSTRQPDAKAQGLALHSLKGSAGSIGAKALQQRAGELEKQLKEQPQLTQQLLAEPQTLEQLQHLLALSIEQLSQWLANNTSAANALPSKQEPLADEAWQHACNELLELLNTGNMRALELSEALRLSNTSEWFSEVAAHISALRFSEATQLLLKHSL